MIYYFLNLIIMVTENWGIAIPTFIVLGLISHEL